MAKVGLYYQPQREAALTFAGELRAEIERAGHATWSCPAWDDKGTNELPGTSLIICVGGDGTMLWAARIVIPHEIPLLGINTGRLGFLTELWPDEVRAHLPRILALQGRIEERSMLEVTVEAAGSVSPAVHALNDVVVGRRSIGRPVYVDVSIDGAAFTTYRADAVLVASATGSTGYNLSAGGPVLHPESADLVVTPVAPHLSMARSLVLPSETEVALLVRSDHMAALSIDGQEDIALHDGDSVRVRHSPYRARFLRLGPAQHFYTTVGRHLMSVTNPSAPPTGAPLLEDEPGAP